MEGVKQMDLARTIVEFVVELGIREIKTDPRRSIRKLVDMGAHFAKGHFQKQFFRMAQNTLKNESSPYYAWVQGMAENVDHHTLTTLGINLGWESWTIGAKQIRALEANQGFNIPWSLTFYVNSQHDAMSQAAYRRLIAEGKSLGIFSYVFFIETEATALETIYELIPQEPNCAFILFLEPQAVTPQVVDQLSACHNLAVSLNSRAVGWETSAQLLARAGCICGIHYDYCSQEDVRHIVSGEWLQKALPSAFAICIAADDCPLENSSAVYTYVKATRNGPPYPIMLLDYYADSLYVDQIISDSPCFLGILADGTAIKYANNHRQSTGQTLEKVGLTEILKQHYRKENSVTSSQ